MENKNWLYFGIAITLIAIVIIVYILATKKKEIINGHDNGFPDPDPGITPGHLFLTFDKMASYKKEIIWDLEGEYYATLLSGNVRMGGTLYTNCRIEVYSGGWKHMTTVGGWPGGFTTIEKPINMKITKVKWVAEQGIFIERYIDEVRTQLIVEG